jgi:hypothetical protein
LYVFAVQRGAFGGRAGPGVHSTALLALMKQKFHRGVALREHHRAGGRRRREVREEVEEDRASSPSNASRCSTA